MNHTTLAGLICYSPAPDGLAAFLRDHVGVPLAPHRHGRLPEHLEGIFGGVHFAVWKGSAARVVPSFRVAGLSDALTRATASGARVLHPPVDLGENKRLVSLAAGEVEVRLIDIA